MSDEQHTPNNRIDEQQGAAVDTSAEQTAPTHDDAEQPAENRPHRPGMTVAAFVVTAAAWVMLPVYYPGALGGGILALILSILALRQPRGAWRNLALVTTVASSVLLLVLALFWTALFLALKYL